MHIKKLHIFLGIIVFLLLTIAEVIWYFNKKDEDFSDMLKKIFGIFIFSVVVVLYMAAF